MTLIDRFVEHLDHAITSRPGTIIIAFVLVSGLAMGGLSGISQEAGADQFEQDVPASEAMEDIEEEFSTNIGNDGSVAQLFIMDDNVLDAGTLDRTLASQQALESRSTLRVNSTLSHASMIARQLDPTAATLAAQRRAVQSATPPELAAAIDAADEAGQLSGQLSTDYNPTAQRAGAAIVVVRYNLPASASTEDTTAVQRESVDVLGSVEGNQLGDNVLFFGQGILQDEILGLLGDTAFVVFPAALLFILFFLVVAYRDPVDMALGLSALIMAVLWTFGIMGYAGIPFSDAIITVFPLLLAVGIDFGIHTINRYREERATGLGIDLAMRKTTDQLVVAFLLVTLTTVFSFLANLVSPLGSIRDFGLVAAAGMTSTFLIFSIYLPAAKVYTDRGRDRFGIPAFGSSPLGSEGSLLGRLMAGGVDLARIAPIAVVVIVLVGGAAGAAYGTGVDTEFNQEAFFPDQDRVETFQQFPPPFAPGDYTFMQTLDILETEFDQGFIGSVTLYIDEPVRSDDSLELIDRTTHDPPDSFTTTADGDAQSSSVVTVIQDYAAVNPEFAEVVDRNDRLGNGVPDRDLDEVYSALLSSPREQQARGYIAADRGSARVDFTVDGDAEQDEAVADIREVSEETPLETVPTGQIVIFEDVIAVTLESAIRSLVAAFVLTAVFLVLSYRYLEGRAVYGIINLIPVLATVGLLVGSMRLAGVPLTPINAPILSISIGLGVDYTVHFTHRFVDEYRNGEAILDSLRATVIGTGGALTGSMLTTVTGLGVLYLALIPMIQNFGILIALGVFYAYACSLVFVPSLVVVWDRYGDRVGLGLERAVQRPR